MKAFIEKDAVVFKKCTLYVSWRKKVSKCTLFSSMKAFIEIMKAFIENDAVVFKKCTLYVSWKKSQ